MDWNNDGMLDLIVGERNGYVNYYRRIGPGDYDLITVGRMRAASGVIDIGWNSAPFIIDWNNDGLLDLLIGDGYYSGNRRTRLYLNSGTASSPRITNFTYIKNAGSDLQVRSCNPHVCDFNGDGKKDFLAGNENGNLVYFENKGTDAAPVFNGSITLKTGGVAIDVGRAARLFVTDWNKDGHLDLLTGDHMGWVVLFLAKTTAVSDSYDELSSETFQIEPTCNPVLDNFSVKLCSPAGPVNIELYDSIGRLVRSCSVDGQSDTAVISAESMAVGVYTIVASDANSVSRCRVVLAN